MALPKPHQIETHKAAFMDYLYERAGRTNGLYTGLWAAYCQEVGTHQRHLHLLRTLQQVQTQDD